VDAAVAAAWAKQARLLACVSGPAGCVAPALGLPRTVLALAGQIYAARNWDLLPLLADHLEEEGWEDGAAHLREDVHCKGCWVLDVVLGRK
jgi:hypothetical protein